MSGHVERFDVFLFADTVVVFGEEGRRICEHRIPEFRSPGSRRSALLLRHWKTAESRIIGIVTEIKGDGFFGYALNLDNPALSKWDHCP
jgi:hypothetical protein